MEYFYTFVIIIYASMVIELYIQLSRKFRKRRGAFCFKLIKFSTKILIVPLWPLAILWRQYCEYKRKKIQSRRWK